MIIIVIVTIVVIIIVMYMNNNSCSNNRNSNSSRKNRRRPGHSALRRHGTRQKDLRVARTYVISVWTTVKLCHAEYSDIFWSHVKTTASPELTFVTHYTSLGIGRSLLPRSCREWRRGRSRSRCGRPQPSPRPHTYIYIYIYIYIYTHI